MSVDPRAALDRFIAALESHYHAISVRRGDSDPAVDDAYYVLGDAFDVYEDALNETYGEAVPFELVDDDDDDEDDLFDALDDDDGDDSDEDDESDDDDDDLDDEDEDDVDEELYDEI